MKPTRTEENLDLTSNMRGTETKVNDPTKEVRFTRFKRDRKVRVTFILNKVDKIG